MIKEDEFLSDRPKLVGSVSNLAAQIGTGWEDRDTSAFISYEGFSDAIKVADYDKLG